MSDAPPPPPDGLAIFEPPASSAPPDLPAYGEAPGQLIAHPGRRALGFIVDGMGTVCLTIVIVFAGVIAETLETLVAIYWVPFASAVLATVLTATLGVTPGKWIAGIRVVHVATGRPTGGWAVLRSLVIVAPIIATVAILQLLGRLPDSGPEVVDPLLAGLILPVLFWIALFVVVVASPQYRGLQDRVGRSIVIRR